MTELEEKGAQVFAEIMGETRAVEFRKGLDAGGFGGAMTSLAAEFAFARVWARDGLERKQRSLVTIGVLIAQRQVAELKNHFRIAVANGLTRRELEEAVLQAVPYCGFPATATASAALIEVLRELGLDTESRTSAERGLL